MRRKYNKSLYENYTVIKKTLDKVDEILNDYISFHKGNFYYYLVRCEFLLEFDNNFIISQQMYKLTFAIKC